MSNSSRILRYVLPSASALLLLLAPARSLAQMVTAPLPQFTAIEHVRLIDGTGRPPQSNVTVVVEGQHIQAIRASTPDARSLPPGTRAIDASGQTMIPGLINAHGHLALVNGAANDASYYTEPHVLAELRQYEHYGVLDMLSLGLNRDLIYLIRAQQTAGNLDGATVFVADRGIGVPGGAPPIPHADDQLYAPKNADEARRDVDEAASRHTNFIKVWVDDLHGKLPKMQPEIYAAVIDEAHKQHVPVAAHVYALADAKLLVAAGVDVLGHSVRDQRVDPELIQAMKKHGTFYIPTLELDATFFLFADHPELLNDPFLIRATPAAELAKLRSPGYKASVDSDPTIAQHRKDLEMAKTNLRLMYRAGVRVGFGTDSGATPLRLPGYAEHLELQLMVEAGLTPLEALHCATQNNAKLLGIDMQTGTVAPGLRANFLLLDGSPAADIANTRRIVSIWHNGHAGSPWTTVAQQDAYKASAANTHAPDVAGATAMQTKRRPGTSAAAPKP
ncbi:amidohydrolase family protein [Acidipila sp. EB88]|uniref:amidohydrolase family protein n=1 Tax=Acidipila sp. EB88 TaxID=2305226 RepID=UPI001315A59A|nr:amidohydrolase family protein [Acidipila sp. EB88]